MIDVEHQPSAQEIKSEVDRLVDWFKTSLRKFPSGRANTEMLSGIDVTTNSGKQRIAFVSSISVIDARTLSVKPYDQQDKALLGQISESIATSPLKLNCHVSTNEVIVKLSENSEARKQELVRAVRQDAEAKKHDLRNLRSKYTNKKTLKEYSASEDDQYRRKHELDKVFGDAESAIDRLVAGKIADF
jgi:ribosome recycling factor